MEPADNFVAQHRGRRTCQRHRNAPRTNAPPSQHCSGANSFTCFRVLGGRARGGGCTAEHTHDSTIEHHVVFTYLHHVHRPETMSVHTGPCTKYYQLDIHPNVRSPSGLPAQSPMAIFPFRSPWHVIFFADVFAFLRPENPPCSTVGVPPLISVWAQRRWQSRGQYECTSTRYACVPHLHACNA